MKISLHLRSLCLAVGLASMFVSPGCATFAADLTAFRSAVDVADMIIDAIDDFTTSYFAAHPDPVKQAAIKAAEAQARTAAAAALSIANGAGDASNGNVAQAFADFETAYSSLLALAQSLGVKVAAPGAKVGVQASPGVLMVPAPADLRPAMVKQVVRPVALSILGDSTLPWPAAGSPTGEIVDGAAISFLSLDGPPPSVVLGIVAGYPGYWEGPRVVFYSEALPISEAVPVGAEMMARQRIGHSDCDRSCGKEFSGLATPSGCWCWRESKTDWRASRWVASR
jgi:hypothetical protein